MIQPNVKQHPRVLAGDDGIKRYKVLSTTNYQEGPPQGNFYVYNSAMDQAAMTTNNSFSQDMMSVGQRNGQLGDLLQHRSLKAVLPPERQTSDSEDEQEYAYPSIGIN